MRRRSTSKDCGACLARRNGGKTLHLRISAFDRFHIPSTNSWISPNHLNATIAATILIFSVSDFSVYLKSPTKKGAIFLEKSIWSKGNDALVALIKNKRKDAKLTQADVAKAFGQRQTWVSHLESGDRRIDVVEFVKLAEVIGFDAPEELKKLVPVILEK